MKQIEQLVEQYWDKIVEYRRWLHAHPELSNKEEKSAAYIAEKLREMGLTPTERVGGYGVTAVIEGARPGKCVGIRADFDALPMQEETGLPFASQNPGVCHACGHDSHPAMLLGIAHILCDMRDRIAGSVKLIFQPAEENSADCGAKKMIADGVLENPHVDAVLAQHINPLHPTGDIMLQEGVATSASDRFFITIQGKSTHAARPETGTDAIVMAAQVISALQTIVSRNTSPLDNLALTIGKIKGGTQYNVVANACEMEGTCRNLNPAVRDKLPERMENIIKGITEGMGGSYSFRYIRGYSPLRNDPAVCKIVRATAEKVLGQEHVGTPDQPSMGGEDFSFFTEQVPCAYYRLGCQKEGEPYIPLHNGRFILDEEAMRVGTRVMVACVLSYLEKGSI